MESLEELVVKQQEVNQILDSQLTMTSNLLVYLRGETPIKSLEGEIKKTSEGIIGNLSDSQSTSKTLLSIHGVQLKELCNLLVIPRESAEG